MVDSLALWFMPELHCAKPEDLYSPPETHAEMPDACCVSVIPELLPSKSQTREVALNSSQAEARDPPSTVTWKES